MSDHPIRHAAHVATLAATVVTICLAGLGVLQLFWSAINDKSFRLGTVLLVFAFAALLIALTASRLWPFAKDVPRWAAATGLALGGVALAVATVGIRASSAPSPSKAEIAALVVAVGIVLGSIPIGSWLAAPGRLRRTQALIMDSTHPWTPTPAPPWARVDWAIVAGLGVLFVAGLALVLPSGPFGHDESIYALKARSWIEGTPTTGFEIYRPIGMPVVGWLVLQFSDTETAFRSASVLLSVLTLGTMWWLGRVVFDRATASLAVITFAGTVSFLRRAPEFLNDVPSSGFLLAAILALWFGLERRTGSWWIVAAAPAAAGAFYMRYGSLLALGIIAVTAGVIWWRAVVDSWRQLSTTALVFALLLTPHVLYAIDLTGSPWGVVRSASTSVGGGGGGLGHYLSWLPSTLAGHYGGLLFAVSVVYTVGAIIAARRGMLEWRSEARTTSFFVAVAVVTTAALGVFTHGEARFVFMPIMLALLVGTRGVVHIANSLRMPIRRLAIGALAVVLVVAFALVVNRMDANLEGITQRRTVLVEASNAIIADRTSTECVIRTSYQPQLTWYTSCASYLFKEPLPESPNAYLVVFENGKRQPTGADLAAEQQQAGGVPIAIVIDPHQRIGDGEVYRYP